MSRLDAVVAEMQRVAPQGQDELDESTILDLLRLTEELIALGGESVDELHRFDETRDRCLDLSSLPLCTALPEATVLVSGGTGCIGTSVLEHLVAHGTGRIVSISRGETKPWRHVEGVEYLHADIRRREDLERVFAEYRPTFVIHCAAVRDPSRAEMEVRRSIETNVLGTQLMLQVAQEFGVERFSYASTGKAVRYFTSDVYAASKKVGEWLVAAAAESGTMLCSSARFTHVVDNSLIMGKLNSWANGGMIRLHDPYIAFYGQSARESSHLLLLGLMEGRPGAMSIFSMRNLGWPVQLLDLAIGTLIESGARVPIYFCGFERGYEAEAYAGQYDPATSGEVGPLINALESWQAEEALDSQCNQVLVRAARSAAVDFQFDELRRIAENEHAGDDLLREGLCGLVLAVLDGNLSNAPAPLLAQMCEAVSRHQATCEDHRRIDEVVLRPRPDAVTVS